MKEKLTITYVNKEGKTVTFSTNPKRKTSPLVEYPEVNNGVEMHVEDMDGNESVTVDNEQEIVFTVFCELAFELELLKTE